MMRISVTGKPESGYTLLEILAVFVLIGLLWCLAYPRVTMSAEKAQIGYAGLLLLKDLRQARETAIADKTELTVKFHQSGYQFEVGDIAIQRDFSKYHISFAVHETEEDEASEVEIIFTPNGKVAVGNIHWQSVHFKGSLMIKEDGSVSWNVTP